MSIAEWKERLRDVPGIETLTTTLIGGRQVFGFNGLIAAVDPMASDQEIETAIRNTARLPAVQLAPAPTTKAIPMTSGVTGASFLAGSYKAKIAAAKARIAQVHADTDAALGKLNSAADAGGQLAKSISDEADALLAELGQFTNGAPE